MTPTELLLRGRKIRSDENGLICLNDIHSAAGFSKNLRPFDWRELRQTSLKTIQVAKLITGKSGNWSKKEMRTVIYTKVGAGGGTYADPRLALDYAEYLNPKLAIEVKEVFLRYKAGDQSLADEIRAKAPKKEPEWERNREIGKAARKGYTDEVNARGVTESVEYARLTNETYKRLYGKTAAQLKAARGMSKRASLRDGMSTFELAMTAASEALSVDRMQEEDVAGFIGCKTATIKAASAIAGAIEADRKDRQKRLA